MLDEVRDRDLSARYPTPVKQMSAHGGSDAGRRKPDIFPGDERGSVRASRGQVPSNTVQHGADGYQVNFENSSVADVASAVLGRTLQLPYVIDSRVQGQVTLSTGRPVSRDELIKTFEIALRLNNGALIAEGGGYRIVPAGEAAAGEIGSIQPYARGASIQPGFGVTVIPLQHVSPDSMLRLLEGFLARAGSVRADAAGNLLLVRGGARERESIIDVVETFDVNWLKGQSAALYPLVNANPDELIQELNQIMQTEPNAINANMVRFQPIGRLNAILLLARRMEHLQTAMTWIRRLDRSNGAGQNLYVYQVENGKASDIAAILNDTFGSGGGGRRSARSEVAPGRDVSTQSSRALVPGRSPLLSGADGGGSATGALGAPAGGAQLAGGAMSPGGKGGVPAAAATATSTVMAGTTTGLASASADRSAIDVRIIADEGNNSLLIRASQADYQKILAALRQIDKAPLQVLINATIAEVTLNDALRYGAQAYLKTRWGQIGYAPGPDLLPTPSFPGFNLLLGSVGDPRVILDALSDVTTVKVVSSPSIVVIDNQPAVLKVGDEVPITVQQSQSVTDPNAPLVSSIRFRETGVILRVTPRVNSSGLVTMDIDQEISQVANGSTNSNTTTSTANSLTPTISQRRVASIVSVYSGQTVALGGLISEQENRDQKSVPLLNQVPLVGELVGKTDKSRKRTELIVFIKPDVIRNSNDASRLTEEMRSKLRVMRFEPQPSGVIERLERRRRRDDWADRSPSSAKDPLPEAETARR